VRLLAKEMLPICWLPPEEIQYLCDRTRLGRALAQDGCVSRSACMRSSPMRACRAAAAAC
jgi:hypothetical protein